MPLLTFFQDVSEDRKSVPLAFVPDYRRPDLLRGWRSMLEWRQKRPCMRAHSLEVPMSFPAQRGSSQTSVALGQGHAPFLDGVAASRRGAQQGEQAS